ncbi:uncharacterized protein BDCG_07294 [Blastomyces dermatitidis ER-3]|uniref:Uncharacterized protein n=1 Tax=Ajellomyces dermatitidis (strain ER-3 / ATCC MYA-2586) TaxID=559297 RepID=A0ABP2F577_AJEDR|nr:uncharacterized protein BDCG_07294 [Blastomyces dermatitidis ER-3]EEQ92174.2 hypothetical protein BDCG_07294 [Blastomyces dermatitidis ER-3]
MYEIPCKSVNNKCLRGAAAASVAAKKARLEAAASMSRGSTAPIATPPPASLAAAAVLPVGASASGPSPPARPSPARDAAGLGPQGPAVPSPSPCGEAPVQSLASITTCLHCAKQLKKRGILYIYFFSHFCYFCYICNNDSCLSQIKISVLKTLTVKNEFDKSVIIDE